MPLFGLYVQAASLVAMRLGPTIQGALSALRLQGPGLRGAQLDGVARIDFPAETNWVLDVKNPAGDEVRERITVNSVEEYDIPNSKGTANFLVKWEGAKSSSSMSVFTPTRASEVKELKGKAGNTLGSYTSEQAGQSVLVAIFDCRGIEPILWHPEGPFTVTSEVGDGKWEVFERGLRDGGSLAEAAPSADGAEGRGGAD
ncbi:unnamed protein product [Prorocentrum cordatum]|uniref:Uncharacterized protein n=1 Tax=Prorocentrum cordatum TaxID=2364126 RepID=A0ABN9X1M5_9DINO|nr:unnamed protein product [Polarella glacialis]